MSITGHSPLMAPCCLWDKASLWVVSKDPLISHAYLSIRLLLLLPWNYVHIPQRCSPLASILLASVSLFRLSSQTIPVYHCMK